MNRLLRYFFICVLFLILLAIIPFASIANSIVQQKNIPLYASMYLTLMALGIATTLVVIRDQKRLEGGRRLIKELRENIKKRMR